MGGRARLSTLASTAILPPSCASSSSWTTPMATPDSAQLGLARQDAVALGKVDAISWPPLAHC